MIMMGMIVLVMMMMMMMTKCDEGHDNRYSHPLSSS